jgi:hypothetical protein
MDFAKVRCLHGSSTGRLHGSTTGRLHGSSAGRLHGSSAGRLHGSSTGSRRGDVGGGRMLMLVARRFERLDDHDDHSRFALERVY